MPRVLAILLGMEDTAPAGYVYRALRNPNIRSDVMRALLEKAPRNVKLGKEFDELISEYEAVRSGRNGYAHGLWYTHDSGAVFLARRDEHGYGLLEAKPEPISALDKLRARIGRLAMSVYLVQTVVRSQKRPPPDSPPPTPAPKT